MDKDKAAAFIEEKRKEKGLTQQQVAEALHVTRQAVSKWEQGKSLPDVDTLLHLAELFQVPVEALLGEEYTAPPAPEPPWYQNVKKSPSPPLYQEPVPLRQLPQGKPNSPWGILLCVPIGLLVVIALIWPCLKTIGYSFTSYNALSTPVWVGLQNYSNMVRDNVFQLELGNPSVSFVPCAGRFSGACRQPASQSGSFEPGGGFEPGQPICAAALRAELYLFGRFVRPAERLPHV